MLRFVAVPIGEGDVREERCDGIILYVLSLSYDTFRFTEPPSVARLNYI
jgi:hypothetical protein